MFLSCFRTWQKADKECTFSDKNLLFKVNLICSVIVNRINTGRVPEFLFPFPENYEIDFLLLFVHLRKCFYFMLKR